MIAKTYIPLFLILFIQGCCCSDPHTIDQKTLDYYVNKQLYRRCVDACQKYGAENSMIPVYCVDYGWDNCYHYCDLVEKCDTLPGWKP